MGSNNLSECNLEKVTLTEVFPDNGLEELSTSISIHKFKDKSKKEISDIFDSFFSSLKFKGLISDELIQTMSLKQQKLQSVSLLNRWIKASTDFTRSENDEHWFLEFFSDDNCFICELLVDKDKNVGSVSLKFSKKENYIKIGKFSKGEYVCLSVEKHSLENLKLLKELKCENLTVHRVMSLIISWMVDKKYHEIKHSCQSFAKYIFLSSVKSFSIINNEINNSYFVSIPENNVKTLLLCKNNISANGLKKIIQYFPQLESLSLSFNFLEDSSISNINQNGVKKLMLHRNFLTSKGFILIMSNFEMLEYLDLSKNKISRIQLSSLRLNDRLSFLNISSNKIKVKGFCWIVNTFKVLETLFLSDNGIGDNLENLPENFTLRRLSLGFNKLSWKGAGVVLRKMKSLVYVNFGNNSLGSDNLEDVHENLVEYMNIDNNKLSLGNVSRIITLFPKLKSLNLSNNLFNREEFEHGLKDDFASIRVYF